MSTDECVLEIDTLRCGVFRFVTTVHWRFADSPTLAVTSLAVTVSKGAPAVIEKCKVLLYQLERDTDLVCVERLMC